MLTAQFGDSVVRAVLADDSVWFKAEDVSNILDCGIQHVKSKNKALLSNLCPKDQFSSKNAIYINESGLYQLITKSKHKLAEQFQEWIFDELIPGIRKTAQEKQNQEILHLKAELREKSDALNRFLSGKKRNLKQEAIFIAPCPAYARQDIFQVGRNKESAIREYKVHDALLVEARVREKLESLALKKGVFMCPFDLLEKVVELIVLNDEKENELVNEVIEETCRSKSRPFECTEDEDAFAAACLLEYASKRDSVVWRDFKDFMIERLAIPKQDFDSIQWKHRVKTQASKAKITIRWRA